MLLVEDSMTHDVVTLTPQATAAEALATGREKRVRHFPVVENGRMVGIVSARDLRSQTAPGDPGRVEALKKVAVSGVMAEDVATAHPRDPIEQAANAMREKKIGCLPVVEGGELVGIITASDVMGALVCLVGAHEPGSRIEVALPDRPGSLAQAAGVFMEDEVNILSVVAAPARKGSEEGPVPERVAVFRVGTIDPHKVVGRLEDAGYRILWPPRP